MFCLLVVLAKLSLLAKWLARKTRLRKPNHGEGIISIKPRPKSAHDFLGIHQLTGNIYIYIYCFIVLLCICVVSCPYVIYYPTVMARYGLFMLKVLLNPSKQTNHINLVVGCHYFPPGPRLPPQPPSITTHWLVPNYTAWWQGHMRVNNLFVYEQSKISGLIAFGIRRKWSALRGMLWLPSEDNCWKQLCSGLFPSSCSMCLCDILLLKK